MGKLSEDQKLKRRQHYRKHRSLRLKQVKTWAAQHVEHCRRYKHKWFDAHKIQIYAKRRAQHARNPERNREYHRQWSKKNQFRLAMFTQLKRLAFPEQQRLRAVKRRALEYNSKFGNQKAIYQIYNRAKKLRQWFDVVVDHKIPLSKGGAHSENNLQIIYRNENLHKGSRLDYVPKVIFI